MYRSFVLSATVLLTIGLFPSGTYAQISDPFDTVGIPLIEGVEGPLTLADFDIDTVSASASDAQRSFTRASKSFDRVQQVIRTSGLEQGKPVAKESQATLIRVLKRLASSLSAGDEAVSNLTSEAESLRTHVDAAAAGLGAIDQDEVDLIDSLLPDQPELPDDPGLPIDPPLSRPKAQLTSTYMFSQDPGSLLLGLETTVFGTADSVADIQLVGTEVGPSGYSLWVQAKATLESVQTGSFIMLPPAAQQVLTTVNGQLASLAVTTTTVQNQIWAATNIIDDSINLIDKAALEMGAVRRGHARSATAPTDLLTSTARPTGKPAPERQGQI